MGTKNKEISATNKPSNLGADPNVQQTSMQNTTSSAEGEKTITEKNTGGTSVHAEQLVFDPTEQFGPFKFKFKITNNHNRI